MKYKSILFIVFIQCFIATSSWSQSSINYTDTVYSSLIKSVQLYPEGSESSSAVWKLGSPDKLIFRFDVLGNDPMDCSYTLISCNADWTPNNLSAYEYLDGLSEDVIVDKQFAYNTKQKFAHYSLTFPNDNIRPTISGNFILMVFKNDGSRDPLITRRLMVYEDLTPINLQVLSSNNVAYRRQLQRVSLSVNVKGFDVFNAFSEVKVHVRQNQMWDERRMNLLPSFVRDQQLTYENMDELEFPGLNEFRRFDIRSIRYQTERVSSIVEEDTLSRVYLRPDDPKRFLRYSSERDENGAFFISAREGYNNGIDADYVNVYFSVNQDFPLAGEYLYVYGGLSSRKLLPDFKMEYNYTTRRYEKTILLKQGFYNYSYAKLGDDGLDLAFIDGNHFETENKYEVFVYVRKAGDRYDRLVGYKIGNSVNSLR